MSKVFKYYFIVAGILIVAALAFIVYNKFKNKPKEDTPQNPPGKPDLSDAAPKKTLAEIRNTIAELPQEQISAAPDNAIELAPQNVTQLGTVKEPTNWGSIGTDTPTVIVFEETPRASAA